MRYVQHPTNNRVLGAPGGWDQQALECGALPVTDVVIEGVRGMASFWEPTAEDIAALAGGAKLRLIVLGESHPPVMVEVEPCDAAQLQRYVAIKVNGTTHTYRGNQVTYAQVVAMAGFPPERILSVTYHTPRKGDSQRSGIMHPGCKPVVVEAGMLFDVGDTSNA